MCKVNNKMPKYRNGTSVYVSGRRFSSMHLCFDIYMEDFVTFKSDIRKLKQFIATKSDTFEKADYFPIWEALFFGSKA